MSLMLVSSMMIFGRSPHGERGLKSTLPTGILVNAESLPAWGAWIEITYGPSSASKRLSLPAWGAWIEMQTQYLIHHAICRSPHGERGLKYNQHLGDPVAILSLPAWGAWIEIPAVAIAWSISAVAPRMGSVD